MVLLADLRHRFQDVSQFTQLREMSVMIWVSKYDLIYSDDRMFGRNPKYESNDMVTVHDEYDLVVTALRLGGYRTGPITGNLRGLRPFGHCLDDLDEGLGAVCGTLVPYDKRQGGAVVVCP
jgi:hypothetical protein